VTIKKNALYFNTLKTERRKRKIGTPKYAPSNAREHLPKDNKKEILYTRRLKAIG